LGGGADGLVGTLDGAAMGGPTSFDGTCVNDLM
jgi:hypothetical protein